MEFDNTYYILPLKINQDLDIHTKPYIIGITGGSGSGKTSILRAIRNQISDEDVCIFSLDDYYFPREVQKIDENGIRNFDLPESINEELFLKDLKKLMRGQRIQIQEYTFNNEKKNPQILTRNPAPIIIVEGLFVFHYKAIRELMDLKVFIHTKENIKLIRRINRDREERNYPVEDVLYRYEKHVMPTFEKFIEPYKEEADIILVNNTKYEKATKVIVGFIRDLIKNKEHE